MGNIVPGLGCPSHPVHKMLGAAFLARHSVHMSSPKLHKFDLQVIQYHIITCNPTAPHDGAQPDSPTLILTHVA